MSRQGVRSAWEEMPVDVGVAIDEIAGSPVAQLEDGVADAIGGDRLVHLDFRSDNVIFAAAGPEHDVVVDWPGASVGAAWVDLVGLLPALELDGGPTPEAVFEHHPVGRAADPDSVNAFVASIAGYFTRMSLIPPPPSLPTVRPFQACQGSAGSARWRTVGLLGRGQQNCPAVARSSAR